uniref:Uncharacterized protein n=1 Tax=Ditylenchus dipsaci TaxID=166011 RepID=A0A915EIP3_9BILA
MLILQLILYMLLLLLLPETSLVDSIATTYSKNQRSIVGPLLGTQTQTHLPSSRDKNGESASMVGSKASQHNTMQAQFSGSSNFLNKNAIDSEREGEGQEMWGARKPSVPGGPAPSSAMNQQTDEQRLLYFLLRQYERAVRLLRMQVM